MECLGNSLVVQWLGLCTFTAKGLGSIPDWGTKIPQAAQWSKNKQTKHHLKHEGGLKKDINYRNFISKYFLSFSAKT